MAERSLAVYLGEERIGELAEGAGIWRFTYVPEWLENASAIAIGPGLPLSSAPILDEGTRRPVQWFFDNLLPEETLRERLAKERNVAATDAFGLLEAYGAESAGALTLLPPGSALPARGRRPLSERDLAKRIRDLPRISLEANAPKKMSLAGAQHKLPIIVEDEAFFEPEGSEPSTHILKPNHPDANSYPHSAVNEWFTMPLAGRLGLSVPNTAHRYCPARKASTGHAAIFLIERFDRARVDEKVQRLHAIDACQLLDLDRSFKLQAMTVESLLQAANATRARGSTRMRIFRWVVFNALVGNRDAHLKNLSFLVAPGGIELAPHYDLLSTASFDAGEKAHEWTKLDMSLPLGGAVTYREVTRSTLLALAAELHLGRAAGARIIDAMLTALPTEADRLLGEFEARDFPRTASVNRAGELRVLRQIRHVVIDEMVRLAAREAPRPAKGPGRTIRAGRDPPY